MTRAEFLSQDMTRESKALHILDIDHLEFYVGNAKQAAHFYRAVLGFSISGYLGPETGIRDRASYLVTQGKIRFILTSPLTPKHPINDHIYAHGDGVRDIAYEVNDAEGAFYAAVKRGAAPAIEPHEISTPDGTLKRASIKTFGDTIHTFVERTHYNGFFLPHFKPLPVSAHQTPMLHAIDHIVGNVGWNEMETWVRYYQETFDFKQFQSFDDKDISTEYTALRSKVMTNATERIKMPINEPAQGKRKSQIEEYIEFYGGPGVQHIALITDDIIHTVTQLRAQGLEFISVPDTYYDSLLDRVGPIGEDLASLKEQHILVDRDEFGYMLQIFTKPVEDRPTLFYEIIQRRGSKSFGKGNFKALFEAIERDQTLRGNL